MQKLLKSMSLQQEKSAENCEVELNNTKNFGLLSKDLECLVK
jgi:hypothetical protein